MKEANKTWNEIVEENSRPGMKSWRRTVDLE